MPIYTYNSAKMFCEILNIEFQETPAISDQLIDEGHSNKQHWGFNHGHTFNDGRKRPQSSEEIEKRRVIMAGNKFAVGGPGSRGKTWQRSTESKLKNKIALLGKKQETVQCPKCNLIGGISNMTRYHFDKCKSV